MSEALERAPEAAAPDRRRASLWGDVGGQLRRSPLFLVGSTVLLLLSVMAVRPSLFTTRDPRTCSLSLARQPPSADAWFGYDPQGCDYFANVVYGARVSMVIGVVVIGGALLVALFFGALAGYYGGWVDGLVSRLTDIAFGLPLILGAILIVNGLRSRLAGVTFGDVLPRGFLPVILALVALGWMTPLRLVRSSVIGVKDADYVQAARALGATDRRILVRHILPNALAPVLVYATITVGVIIAAEATLSFLGVGLQLPAISWGLQINLAQNFVRTSPFLLFFPGVFLSVTVLSFIMIGDALRDALDPRLR